MWVFGWLPFHSGRKTSQLPRGNVEKARFLKPQCPAVGVFGGENVLRWLPEEKQSQRLCKVGEGRAILQACSPGMLDRTGAPWCVAESRVPMMCEAVQGPHGECMGQSRGPLVYGGMQGPCDLSGGGVAGAVLWLLCQPTGEVDDIVL